MLVAERDLGAAGGRELLAVCVVVRRPFATPAWYLCDLKVAPERRGGGLARRLLAACARSCLGSGEPAFGVSMDPATGPNRMLRTASRLVGAGASIAAGPRLGIWSLGYADWRRAESRLTAALGPVTFFDPAGTKDIVLESTGRPMPLLHAQHGPCARPGGVAARDGHVHMLCLPLDDPLATALGDLGIAVDATASVLQRGMAGFDWRQLLTSDI